MTDYLLSSSHLLVGSRGNQELAELMKLGIGLGACLMLCLDLGLARPEIIAHSRGSWGLTGLCIAY